MVILVAGLGVLLDWKQPAESHEGGVKEIVRTPAPDWILESSKDYIVSYIGKNYYDKHISIDWKSTNPSIDKVGAKYRIYYNYEFKVKGDFIWTSLKFGMWLDEEGSVIEYEGPTKPYEFAVSKAEAIDIAKREGMSSGGSAEIRMGSDFGLDESYIIYVSTENLETGKPEVVYVDVDSGEVLGTYIYEEAKITYG